MDKPQVSKPDEIQKGEARHVRVNSAKATGRAGETGIARSVISTLQNEDGWIRGNAIEALVKIGLPAVPDLIEALQDTRKEVRRGAAEALGKIGDTAAVPALIAALKDHRERVRRNSALALGQIGEVSAVPALIEALEDENRDVRENAAEALGRLGDSFAVPALLRASKDRDSDVRYNAAEALGKIGDSNTLPGKILSDARFSAKERIEILNQLRRAWYVKGPTTYRYTFPDTRMLCQTLLHSEDADARTGAQAVLRWLDEGGILVRASQRDSASDSSHELLRAAHGGASASQSATLLRGASEPQNDAEPSEQ